MTTEEDIQQIKEKLEELEERQEKVIDDNDVKREVDTTGWVD